MIFASRINLAGLAKHGQRLARLSSTYKPIQVAPQRTDKGINVLKVEWSNGQVETYPAVWLRDNCRCPKCYIESALSRSFLMKDLDIDLSIPESQIVPSTYEISVKWSDGHQSNFKPMFFEKYGRGGTSADYCGHLGRGKPVFWGSDYKIKPYGFNDILSSKKSLLNFLKDLNGLGLVLIQDVPKDLGGLPTILKRIGFSERTHYGSLFKVETKPDANNVAYTGSAIGLHLDLPYYEKTPSIQFLHCIEQTRGPGGGNIFADGFHAAEVIKKSHPKEYDILTKVDVTFCDIGFDEEDGGMDFYKMHKWPTIRLDNQGNYVQVSFSNQQRSRTLSYDDETMHSLYKALMLYNNVMYSPELFLTHKLNEGDCVVFDNQRVLHGREGFTLKPGNNRLYQGCYITWDEVRSRMNVLEFVEEEKKQ